MAERLRAIDAYQVFSALKLHFTKDNYDAQKYNYMVRVNEASFLKRKDKYQFGKLANKYQYKNQLIMACVASFTYGDVRWAGDVCNIAEDCLNQLKKNVQSLMYVFKNDCEVIANSSQSLETCIYNSSDLPLIYKLMIRGEISMETLAIFENEVKVLSKILNNDVTSLICGSKCLTIKKYSNFIQYDRKTIANIITESFSA